MSIVLFPKGKRLHINVNNGETLCKKEITKDALTFYDIPKDGWFCPKCMSEVGYLQLIEYLGTDSDTQKTIKQIKKSLTLEMEK